MHGPQVSSIPVQKLIVPLSIDGADGDTELVRVHMVFTQREDAVTVEKGEQTGMKSAPIRQRGHTPRT